MPRILAVPVAIAPQTLGMRSSCAEEEATMTTMVRQGDILLELVEAASDAGQPIGNDPDGAVVLARGEVTGHRHALYGGSVTMFRDEALARDMSDASLYVGHVVIERDDAALTHEEHDAIPLARGVWRVRRQREFDAAQARIVAD